MVRIKDVFYKNRLMCLWNFGGCCVLLLFSQVAFDFSESGPVSTGPFSVVWLGLKTYFIKKCRNNYGILDVRASY